jgi:hypothetical protein
VEDYDLPPRYLSALPPMVIIRSSDHRSWWVALAVCDSGDGFPQTTKERDANARLIAAAPELLEALRSADEWMAAVEEPLADGAPFKRDRAMIRAALAKATQS